MEVVGQMFQLPANGENEDSCIWLVYHSLDVSNGFLRRTLKAEVPLQVPSSLFEYNHSLVHLDRV